MIRAFVAATLLAMPSVTRGQTGSDQWPPIYRNVPQSLTATISGRILDAETGRPVANALVSARWPARQGRVPTDSTGVFLLDWVEPGPVTLDVNCPSRTMLGPHVLDSVIRTDTGQTHELELRIRYSSCVEPDSAARRVSVRGVYSAGFEESRFVPCRAATAEFLQLWSPPHLRNAWVEFSPTLGEPTPKQWPEPSDEHRYPNWYVEWSGVLTGPGYFGHLGVSPYRLVVDSVDVVRTFAPADCTVLEPVRVP